jgi:signal transduction histidine kinase
MQLTESLISIESTSERALMLDRAVAEFALAVARAHEADELRAALHNGLDLLAHADGGSRYSLCEISAGPDGAPLIAWQAGRGGFSIAEGGDFGSWFVRARRSAGYFEPGRSGKWLGLLSVASGASGWETCAGLFVEGAEPDEERRELFALFAGLSTAALARIDRRKTENQHRRRIHALNEDALSWLELGADIVWEANAEGAMHCRRILNRRDDLAQAIEGANLAAFVAGEGGRNMLDLLLAERSVRHLRVTPAGAGFDADHILYLSGVLKEGDFGAFFVGTVTGVHARAGVAEAALLNRMRATRFREEELRVEAEAMLEGLRLLLASSTSREKLARLAALLAEGVKGTDAAIVELGFDGVPRMLAPEPRRLADAVVPALRAIAADLAERSIRLYTEDDPETGPLNEELGFTGERVVALPLPMKSQTVYFLCGLRGDRNLSTTGLAFAERFALLLRQALLLREEQSQLAQTAKMAALGQMSASIAHELKQPLNTISLAAQNLEALLEAPNFDPAAVEVKIARMMAQVERASNVIDRMRRFGRKSIGDNAAVPVREMVEGVQAMIRHVLDRAGVEVEIDIEPDVSVMADGLQLEQVLANLIQNAADAISGIGGSPPQGRERGTGRLRIAAFAAPDRPGKVVLRVEDNGPGFPAGVLDRALEPFFTTKPAEQGTGLGLAICDAIIRESGGSLTLGNHEGGGFVELTVPSASPA